MAGATGKVVCLNSIFYLAAADDYAIYSDDDVGAILHLENNCVYSAAGAVTNPFYDETNDRSIPGTGTILEDPLFMDAANNDFTLKPTSPCLNAGVPAFGGYPDLGPWQRIGRIRR